MAITANMTTSEGVALTGAYLVIKNAYVKKFDGAWTGNDDDGYTQGSASFKLIYDVGIYLNADKRAEKNNSNNIIKNRHIDHHKCDYDLTASDNPFKLAYADLKTNSELSNVADA